MKLTGEYYCWSTITGMNYYPFQPTFPLRCLAAINMEGKEIQYYDSLSRGLPSYDAKALGRKWDSRLRSKILKVKCRCLINLLKYLGEEHLDKKKSPLNTDEWTTTLMTVIPQQTNWSDCGMFVCKYAEYLSRRKRITFTQTDMPLFRFLVLWEKSSVWNIIYPPFIV